MRTVIALRRHPLVWTLHRRRRPLARLWDADLNYVATIADGGICESWGAYARRLGRALVGRRPAPVRRVEQDLGAGGVVTIDL
jgi:hypothetical protein